MKNEVVPPIIMGDLEPPTSTVKVLASQMPMLNAHVLVEIHCFCSIRRELPTYTFDSFGIFFGAEHVEQWIAMIGPNRPLSLL